MQLLFRVHFQAIHNQLTHVVQYGWVAVRILFRELPDALLDLVRTFHLYKTEHHESYH